METVESFLVDDEENNVCPKTLKSILQMSVWVKFKLCRWKLNIYTMLSFLFREFLINEIQMLDMKKSYENKFISEYNKIIILMQKILHIVVTLTRKNMNLP